MHSWQLITLISAVAFFAGAVVSILIYRLLGGQTRQGKLQQELAAAKEELANYRAHVSQHFIKSAKLLNKLTFDYKEVYQHLAQGAQNLADPRLSANNPSQRMLQQDLSTLANQLTSVEPTATDTKQSDPQTESIDKPEQRPPAAKITPQEGPVSSPIRPPKDYADKS
jgi:uncharacterized membrane-anchored protein YhcB (DUF1043 family)